MTRPKNLATLPAEPALDQDRINTAMVVMRQDASSLQLAASQHDAAVRAVAQQLGYSLPADCTDPDLIQRDIGVNMRRSVEACLDVGRGLAVLKTACGHGNFMARLEVMGIEPVIARKFVHAAERFSNRKTSFVLAAAGTQSKLFELLVLDDDQNEELELTGQTGELKLDAVADMSVRELRHAVRELKQDAQATAEVMRTKSEVIDKLRTDQHRIARAKPDEKLADVKKEAAQMAFEARAAVMGNLRLALQAILDAATGGDETVFMAGLVGSVQAEVTKLRDTYNLPDMSTAVDAELAAEVAQWADPA